MLRRQVAIKQKLAEIDYYTEKLDRAKKYTESGTFELIGKLGLGLFLIVFIIGLILYICGFGKGPALIVMTISFVFLLISIVAQSNALKLDSQIKEYSARLRAARKDLLHLNTPSQP